MFDDTRSMRVNHYRSPQVRLYGTSIFDRISFEDLLMFIYLFSYMYDRFCITSLFGKRCGVSLQHCRCSFSRKFLLEDENNE
jgi:hypothetical protein